MKNSLTFFIIFFSQAGFLDGITNVVPGIVFYRTNFFSSRVFFPDPSLKIITKKCCYYVITALGGVNLKELLNDAAEEVGGKLLLDFNDTVGDRIQVFLE